MSVLSNYESSNRVRAADALGIEPPGSGNRYSSVEEDRIKRYLYVRDWTLNDSARTTRFQGSTVDHSIMEELRVQLTRVGWLPSGTVYVPGHGVVDAKDVPALVAAAAPRALTIWVEP